MEYRDDMFVGTESHPSCGFFEVFPSSPDPYCTLFGIFACSMSGEEKHAEVCKGDYLECPIAYGKSTLIPFKENLTIVPEGEKIISPGG